MKVRTYSNGEEWEIEFSHGVQTFTLEYKIEDKESAEIMAGQLAYALNDFKKQEVRKFADWLKEYRGVSNHTTAEFQVRRYFDDIKNETEPFSPVLDFTAWYSGMEKEKIKKAYQRYLSEILIK